MNDNDLTNFCCQWLFELTHQEENEENMSFLNDTDASEDWLEDFENATKHLCDSMDFDACFDIETKHILRVFLPQILLSFIAIILNVAEILYFYRRKRQRTPSDRVLLSLAVADAFFSVLVFTFFILFSIDAKNPFINTETVSDISDQLIQFSINASIFHVLCISIERLIAISFPMKYKANISNNKINLFVFLIWLITVIIQVCLLLPIFVNVEDDEDDENRRVKVNQVSGGIMYMSGVSICVIYTIMIYKVMKQSKFLRRIRNSQSHCNQGKKRARAETVAFFTALVLSISFLVFTIPIATEMLFRLETSDSVDVCIQCLLILNSIFNPIAYFWRNYYLRKQRKRNLDSTGRTSVEDVSQYSIADMCTATIHAITPKTARKWNIASGENAGQENGHISPASPDGIFRTFTDKWDGHMKYR